MRSIAGAAAVFVAIAVLLQAGTASIALRTEADRDAFRRWFTFLAEAQYFNPAAQRPAEIADCSSFVRYAYREALRNHDSGWAAESQLPLILATPSVKQYNYPRTPRGPDVFQTGPQSFGQFANAETLYRYNAFFVTRDFGRAEPGDLLFYRHASGSMPFHSMIVLGHSQIGSNSSMFVVYDTGRDGTNEGEIKRLTYQELLHFPDPQWEPISRNAAFLGVFRWNILKKTP